MCQLCSVELRKQSSCYLHLIKNIDDDIAFKVVMFLFVVLCKSSDFALISNPMETFQLCTHDRHQCLGLSLLSMGKVNRGKLEIAIFSIYSRVVLCDTTVDFLADE